MDNVASGEPDPERLVLEALPNMYRSVFALRAVEGMSAAETAAWLHISDEAGKTRLRLARYMLQKNLRQHAGVLTADVSPFPLSRCARVVAAVFQRIGSSN